MRLNLTDIIKIDGRAWSNGHAISGAKRHTVHYNKKLVDKMLL